MITDIQEIVRLFRWRRKSIHLDIFLKIVGSHGVGSTLLELGCGHATEVFLATGVRVISIEHDPNWANLICTSKMILAPLAGIDRPWTWEDRFLYPTAWYDRDIIRRELEGEHYDAILVDGPYYRSGFSDNLDLFDLDLPIYFDDVFPDGGPPKYATFQLFHEATERKRRIETYTIGHKMWGVSYPED